MNHASFFCEAENKSLVNKKFLGYEKILAQIRVDNFCLYEIKRPYMIPFYEMLIDNIWVRKIPVFSKAWEEFCIFYMRMENLEFN
jgi:hypothetical protein